MQGDERAHEGRELGPAGWRPTALEHRPELATLIVDPRAGRGRVGRALPSVQEALARIGLPHRVDIAHGPGEATRLAADALDRGERFLVAVGSDGTTNEVVNAMLRDDRPVQPDAVLAVLAANSGSDIVRTFGLPQEPAAAVPRLAAGSVYEIDVGKATVSTPDGTRSRYFVNMAQAGLLGAAAAHAARLPRFLGRGRSFLGFWLAMAGYRRPRVRLQGDRRELEETVTNVLIANLQFFGEGMMVSSAHSLDDVSRTVDALRTAPLWGLRTRNRLMHDGLSFTREEAILRHAGQAALVTLRYQLTTPAEKAALLAFLNSL